MTPPPQLWKISGGVPPCMTVVSLVLKASFSSIVMLILTLGCLAIYSLAISCQSVLPGSTVVICHHSTVTFSAAGAAGCAGAAGWAGWAGACVGAGAAAGAQAAI